jgi:hypothetical protein
MNRKSVIEIIVFLFILLFVYASISKLFDHSKFVLQLSRSPILGPYANFISWFIPGIEMAIAVFLMLLRTRFIGLLASVALMIIFTVYIILILFFSNFIPCSCGGVLEYMGWGEHLVFNSLFVVLGLIAIVLQFREDKVNGELT